jgi:diketogulonate reductase-like aldo/keto reductase
VLAIPGTGNPEHLAENVAAGALRLSADEMSRLSALYRLEHDFGRSGDVHIKYEPIRSADGQA